jgi:aminopeptidase N
MKNIFFAFLILTGISSQAQLLTNKSDFTRADTLRGSLRPERTSFDMLKYDLHLKIDPQKKQISGFNKITFKVLERQPVMQLDLFANMQIDSIVFKGQKLKYKREFNAVFIDFEKELKKGKTQDLKFYFNGKPIIAKNPPWDGGFIFDKDKNGKDWIAVAVQGTGASLWYPNKDHLSDEPDEAEIHLSVPEDLVAVSNGILTNTSKSVNGYKTYSWKVSYPINNYNITVNIGDYVNFTDKYQDLKLDYWVLSYNLEKAKAQFEQVKPMMACFYEKIGEYPFPEDSFKLVETPYLGMEHQSAVAYGNKYRNGYLGSDMSGTGIGLKFDFIIIHEAGHEWFGNSVSVKDVADLWIHESFTSYMEAIFVECEYGKDAALDYIYGLRRTIGNDRPLIGDYGVNHEGSGDMYYKGSNMLNTLRSLVEDDELWWKTLQGFHETYKYQTISTSDVVAYFSEALDKDLTAFFKQYLEFAEIPKLVFRANPDKNNIEFKWESDVEDFDMPIELDLGTDSMWIFPDSKRWKKLEIEDKDPKVKMKKFYVDVEFK